MGISLGHAKADARRLLHQGDHERALRIAEHALATVPADPELRLLIADALAAAGLREGAVEVYRAVATHDLATGHPLQAFVAGEAMKAAGESSDAIEAAFVSAYAAGSPRLARFAVRPSPADPTTDLPPLDDGADGATLTELAARARASALDFSASGASAPQQFHPLPFLSELRADALRAVLRSAHVRRLPDGAPVMRQGDPGTALYLVASGEVRVFVTSADGAETEIAHLFENTLFGEMALMSDQPRSASVAAVGAADIVEVTREALARVTAEVPTAKEVLNSFARERLIRNLLGSSPLFTPFSKAQQADLLRRFEGHDVAAGTAIIREGEPGRGLFVVLTGDLEVVADANGAAPLATLRSGDIFGEMSLVNDQPTTATVLAVTSSTVLFLPRTYVERLAAAIPEIREYFETVALARARDNTLRLDRVNVPADIIELDTTDVLLL